MLKKLLTLFSVCIYAVFFELSAQDTIVTYDDGESYLLPEQLFTVSPIDDEILERITGKSYKEGCGVDLENMSYLTVAHYDFEGNVRMGELICNSSIAVDLIDIFFNLYNARYPIESIRLIDDFDADDVKSMQANNTSCFNYREIAGSRKLSKHALGLAIDINPLYNPYVRQKGSKITVSPPEGRDYIDRDSDLPYKIDLDDLCYKEFTSHGFKWGGDWKSVKDYQHFEK